MIRALIGLLLLALALPGRVGAEPAGPLWPGDPMNLFVVLEGGDAPHISLLDGERFEPIHRFPSRPALPGPPAFSPDGRYAYVGSPSGWITQYDLWTLQVAAEVRAGTTLQAIAVSSDGRWLMAANQQPHTIELFDAGLRPVKSFAAQTLDGRRSSRVAAVRDVAPRRSFIVSLPELPELWEISYDPGAAPIHDGLVHDYRMGEAIARPGFLGVRRTPLDAPLGDVLVSPNPAYVLGAGPVQADGSSRVQVLNLDVRRVITTLAIAGTPQPAAGVGFEGQGRRLLAIPNASASVLHVIEPGTWKAIADIPTPGPGGAVYRHPATPYLWVDSALSPTARHTLGIIDSRSLALVARMPAPPGATLAPVEFTRDGRFAVASWQANDGALIVYDARTFQEIRRVPMTQPHGAYNVFNRIAAGGIHER